MNEFEQEEERVGCVYAITANGEFLRKKGHIKTFSTIKEAEKYIDKEPEKNYKVERLVLKALYPISKCDYTCPTILHVLPYISRLLESNIPTILQYTLESGLQEKVLRHTPLHCQKQLQPGDRDVYISLELKMKIDAFELEKYWEQQT